MKKLTLALYAMGAFAGVTFAGPEYDGKETKAVARAVCPQWYADNEWNVDLWGTYLFTGNDWADDRYLDSDHAWGGGIDVKYFFRRYFGVGIEGWAVDAKRHVLDISGEDDAVLVDNSGTERRALGAVLGTLTLRYPIPCTRFAPYVFTGGGAVFGGGERDNVVFSGVDTFHTIHEGSQAKGIGQFGGGIEIRITPHIGWMSDFSWNVVDGPDNNFGMVRSGITFAF